MKQTKIVCTISDRHCDVEFLRELFEAGMNVVRMNTAHATPDGLREIIRNTRAVSPYIGILIDTKGPEIRTTSVQAPIAYKTGEVVTIKGRPDKETTHDEINLSYADIAQDVKVGDDILFDDGALSMQVTAIEGKTVVVRVNNDGVLGARKSVNVPGEHINLPALTERDRANIMLAIEEDIDFIAHSFVRSAADVKAVQDILDDHNSDIKIISKIENQEGVDNIEEIIDASYGIMVARGDLAIEVPFEKIPGIQRMIIRKCVEQRKPVIVATQMLHTMIQNPRPTRAEVTDIANAVWSNTDALMLSGETANGKYPVEAVRTMASVAEQAEQDRIAYGATDDESVLSHSATRRTFLAHAAIQATRQLGVAGIITDALTGGTTRALAAFRGPKPVLAICYRDKTRRLLSLSYGVATLYQKEEISPDLMFMAALRVMLQQHHITREDQIAYLSGSLGEGGGSSFIEINAVGKVLNNSYRFHVPNSNEVRGGAREQ